VFDYFLSAYGEKSLSQIEAHIQNYARANLPKKAARETIALLHNYIDYKKPAQTYMHQSMTPEQRKNPVTTLGQIYYKLKDMRQQYFTPSEEKALFGAEDAYDQYALKRMRVSADSSLSKSKKAERLASIDASAPAFIRQNRQQTVGYIQREQHVAKMRANGASKKQIFDYRAQQVGEKKARHLAKIDATNTAWKKRYDEYSQQRKSITGSTGLSDADKKAAVKQLRQRYFKPGEIEKVRTEDEENATSQ
jgi:lipase chaperone LimK